ncbi:L,D-transpeptidase-like protein [Rhodovulum adriaticum]|uniref:L,D-transpeptidase-like protein n=2 Tax=Rhodovulum adriaticum TaxID=35804 RepID=A0A4R2NJW2_RHOAD|nr:L,D-transpeptidase-like protein [Rhodovulum adriaticum]
MLSQSLRLFGAAILIATLPGANSAQADMDVAAIPAWLAPHVGTGEGQIAPVVLDRARALYQRKRDAGAIANSCYLAMDATRPSTAPDGEPAGRFYVICEADKTFRAVSSGYGNGRKLRRADFSNGRECARHFSNAEGSKLTMGGAYVTAETRTSFKGYYREAGEKRPFHRTFLLFEGEGETENAREREIGGHQAVFLKWQCRFENPDSAYADDQGYVPFGRLVNYTGGRSNGCTSWSPDASEEIIGLVEDNPTTLYIYPESRDIDAVAKAVRNGGALSGSGPYWNTTCLTEIGAPRFWPKRTLQPIIDEWRAGLPKQPPLVLPICK